MASNEKENTGTIESLNQIRTKFLRYIIDVDGSTPDTYAKRVFGKDSALAWFYDWDPARRQYNENTSYALLYDFCWAYWDRYGYIPTDDTIMMELDHHGSLSIFEKKDILRVLNEVRVFGAVESEFEHLREHLVQSYLRVASMALVARYGDSISANNPTSAIQKLSNGLTELLARSNNTGDRGSVWLTQLTDGYRAKLVEGEPFTAPALPYPFSQWNAVLGGLKRGEIVVFAAAHNVGKSFVGHEIAYSLLERGYSGACVELEMLDTQIMLRYAARLSRIPSMKIEKNALSEEERELLDAALLDVSERADNNRLLFVPGHLGNTVTKLKREIEIAFGTAKPDFLVVDFLTAMKPSRGNVDGWEAVQVVTQELKDLALYFGCVVITMVHLNRKKDVNYQSVERLCDVVIHCTPDPNDPYIPPSNTGDDWVGKPGKIDCFVERNRNGPKHVTFPLSIEFATASVRQYGDYVNATPLTKALTGRSDDSGDDDDAATD